VVWHLEVNSPKWLRLDLPERPSGLAVASVPEISEAVALTLPHLELERALNIGFSNRSQFWMAQA
jgi:hypothetical protein